MRPVLATQNIHTHSLEHSGVILVPPYEDLCYGPEGLHQQLLVAFGHIGVLQQHVVLEPAGRERQER